MFLIRLLFIITVLTVNSIAQPSWFPYNPLPTTNAYPFISLALFPIIDSTTGLPKVESRIRFGSTVIDPFGIPTGDFTGEFWLYIDLSIGSTNTYVPNEPLLYPILIDSDLFSPLTIPISMLLPPGGPINNGFGLEGIIVTNSPQWGGSAFYLDLQYVFTIIKVGEYFYDPTYSGMPLIGELHLIANWNHETEGSGWFYLKSNFQILLL